VPLAEVSSAHPSPAPPPSSARLPSSPTASTAVKTDAKTGGTAAEATTQLRRRRHTVRRRRRLRAWTAAGSHEVRVVPVLVLADDPVALELFFFPLALIMAYVVQDRTALVAA
jgi:Flp pilus assembly protein TadB